MNYSPTARILPLVAFLFATSAFAETAWQTDYKAALTQAKSENKLVLLDFTGSDWCPWCIKLDKDIFQQPEFQKFASKKLVLVELDFPQGKPQADAVKQQNEELRQRYNVEGYPILILLNPNGKEIARNIGYLTGGPSAFIRWVEQAKEK